MTDTRHGDIWEQDTVPYAGGKLLYNLLLFGRLCKSLGMDVTPNRMIEVARALEFIELGRKQDVYHTLRALIVVRQRDLELFDRAFNLFWKRPADEWATLDLEPLGNMFGEGQQRVMPPLATDPQQRANSEGGDPGSPVLEFVPTYSQREILRHKDFAEMSAEEITFARQMIVRLSGLLGERKTRRLGTGKGSQIDLRRAFRSNMRFSGEIMVLPTQAPIVKPRPLVLICDVSGSMERYTRVLLHFAHTLANSMYQVESFVFGTRLTRITRSIRRKSVEIALSEVSAAVQDWGGGTRIGDALRRFNYAWGRRVLGRGAVVLLITDGWDRGNVALLEHEVARLRRSAYRLMWLNPLLGVPHYAPLTRGAQAMLPYVDDFLPIHNLVSVEMLVKELSKVNWRRPGRTSRIGSGLPGMGQNHV